MNNNQKQILSFEEHCKQIQQMTALSVRESEKEKEARIQKLKKDYGLMFEYYFPHYCTDKRTKKTIKCSWFQKKAANLLLKNRIIRLILNWYRGAAKSTHANIGFPIFLWINKELNTMILVGENDDKADILLSDVQAEFESNLRLKNDYGDQNNFGNWSDGHFVLKDNTAFFSVGLGMSPRGMRNKENRPDYIVCDDLDSKKRSKNPKLVREAVEWINEDLMGTFGTFAERFVLVNNLINKTSILTSMLKELKEAIYMKVVAHDKDFNPEWPERTSKEYWQKKSASTPYRSYQREYMSNPIEEGTVFKDSWIKWTKILPLHKYEQIVAYCDPSFKGTTKNDFKAIKVWGRIGKDLHLIKAFVRQTSVGEMVRWFYDLHENTPTNVIIYYYMEANFIQDMLLDEFTEEGSSRGYQLPIRGDYRKKPDKFQRIEATSPYYERGFVFYNEALKDDTDMLAGIDQLTAFEKGSGAPDDSPDADEGAMFYLQKSGRDEKLTDWVRLGKRKQSDW